MMLEKICSKLREINPAYIYHSKKVNKIYFSQGSRIPKRGTDKYFEYYRHINKMKKIEDFHSKIENYLSNLNKIKFFIHNPFKKYEDSGRLNEEQKEDLSEIFEYMAQLSH